MKFLKISIDFMQLFKVFWQETLHKNVTIFYLVDENMLKVSLSSLQRELLRIFHLIKLAFASVILSLY